MNYLNLPDEWTDYDKSRVVILPVAYGKTVSYGKGTENGPKAIIEASHEIELYDEELGFEPFDAVVHTAPFVVCEGESKDNVEFVHKVSKGFIKDGKFVIMLGGEHSITTGLVKALKDEHDFGVLQIDAHTDLRDDYEGDKYSHATVMRRVSELNVPLVQVGIRAISKEEVDAINNPENNIKTDIFYMHQICREFKDNWVNKVLEKLPDKVFITIDLDGIDPSLVPATGTPEPGGFFWWELLELLRKVFKSREVIGADVVELAPIDGNNVSDFVAAKLVHKLIGYKFEGEFASKKR